MKSGARILLSACCLAAGLAGSAMAQANTQYQPVPKGASLTDAFKGMGSSSKDPIQIDAENLEIREQDGMAVFTGNVTVRQKDTVLKTQALKVYFDVKGSGGSVAASPQTQKIRRYEAETRILINQKDHTVTGDSGWFDMSTNTAQINRNVVITQGTSVARGDRLDVDLRTGQYKLNRPQMLFEVGGANNALSPGAKQ